MGVLFCLIEDFFGLVVGVLFGWGFLCLIGFLGVLGWFFFCLVGDFFCLVVGFLLDWVVLGFFDWLGFFVSGWGCSYLTGDF